MRFMPFVKGKKGFQMAGGGVSDSGGGGGGSYVLPVASANTLGGVKVGEGLSITPEGVLSSSGGSGGGGFSVLFPNETQVGTYDGSPLYAKTLSGSFTSSIDTDIAPWTSNHSLDNVSKVYGWYGCLTDSNSNMSINRLDYEPNIGAFHMFTKGESFYSGTYLLTVFYKKTS